MGLHEDTGPSIFWVADFKVTTLQNRLLKDNWWQLVQLNLVGNWFSWVEFHYFPSFVWTTIFDDYLVYLFDWLKCKWPRHKETSFAPVRVQREGQHQKAGNFCKLLRTSWSAQSVMVCEHPSVCWIFGIKANCCCPICVAIFGASHSSDVFWYI